MRYKVIKLKLCIDLCAGLKGFSQAFEESEDWEVVTVELNKKQKPTICADVCSLPLRKNLKPEVLLMSPPCTRFSLANPHWPKKGIKKALELVGACLEAVDYLKPKRWLLENPKGRLRWFIGTPRQTVRYSDYDMTYKATKPTDFWGNIQLPMVKGIRKGFVGHYEKRWFAKYMPRNPGERAKVPYGMSEAVFQGVNNV